MIIKKIKGIAWLVIVSAAMLFSCSEELPVLNTFDGGGDIPTVTIENMRTTYTENGKNKGKLQANLVKSYDDAIEPYMEFPKGISIVMFDENDKIETSMTANKAIYYRSKRTWEAMGNVVISNINGDILKTQKLFGDDNEKKIFTNELVQITKSDGTVINGKGGFESNIEFTIYQFIDVNGRIFFRDEFEVTPSDNSIQNKQATKEKPDKFIPKQKEKPQLDKKQLKRK
ncbi:MAG: LPS export ABC transporter periplasmic protein LptC [Bacteroidales bacterium]|nr:LPS export ABC transporter periplasmic protein LptC [Bacteroidales bacterium]